MRDHRTGLLHRMAGVADMGGDHKQAGQMALGECVHFRLQRRTQMHMLLEHTVILPPQGREVLGLVEPVGVDGG